MVDNKGAWLSCAICGHDVDYDDAVPLDPSAEPESWESGPAHVACRERYICLAWAVVVPPKGGILIQHIGSLSICGTKYEAEKLAIRGTTLRRVLVLHHDEGPTRSGRREDVSEKA